MSSSKEYDDKLSEDLLKNLYLEKRMSFREIAKYTETSYDAVRCRIHKYKIPVRNNSEAKQKYKIDSYYFDKIDTCQKAYFLGFIIADGWVSKTGDIGIALSAKDEEILVGLKNELKSEHPIKNKENGKYKVFTFKNKNIWEKLNYYGCIPNKSLVVNLQQTAEKAQIIDNFELLTSLLLGYFDGDGGFTKWIHPNGTTIQYEMNITGTHETCKLFENVLSKAHSHYSQRYPERKNNNTTLRFSGRNVCRTAAEILYKNIDKLNYYLTRKYNIYKEL